MVAVGTLAPRLGLGRDPYALQGVLFDLAPQIALASVVAGVFGVVAALAAGFPRFWMRALVALVITTATLFAYVWERSAGSLPVQPAAAEVQPASR